MYQVEKIRDFLQIKTVCFQGDLVNSVSSSTSGRERLLGTEQYEQEWQIYRNLLERTNVTKYTKWLDLKGNHGKLLLLLFFSRKRKSILLVRYIYGFKSRFIE